MSSRLAIIPARTRPSEESPEWAVALKATALNPNRFSSRIIYCDHPEYRDQLHHYLELTKAGHTPQSLSLAFAMHRQLARHGDMRRIEWEEFR